MGCLSPSLAKAVQVAAHSEGGAGIRQLCAEPTDDATLGAQWDSWLLTELPSLDDERDRFDRRSSSSTEIRSNSLSSTQHCGLVLWPSIRTES